MSELIPQPVPQSLISKEKQKNFCGLYWKLSIFSTKQKIKQQTINKTSTTKLWRWRLSHFAVKERAAVFAAFVLNSCRFQRYLWALHKFRTNATNTTTHSSMTTFAQIIKICNHKAKQLTKVTNQVYRKIKTPLP